MRSARIAPATLRQASYGTIKIGTYQSLKRAFVARPEGEQGPLLHLGTGNGSYSSGFASEFLQLLRDFPAAAENSGVKFTLILREAGQLSAEFGGVTVNRCKHFNQPSSSLPRLEDVSL